MRKKLISTACIIAMLISSVFCAVSAEEAYITADEATVDANGVVTVKGMVVGSDTENCVVTLNIFHRDKPYSGLTSAENQLEYVSAFDDTMAEPDGSFEFKLKFSNSKSGFYNVRIGAEGISAPYSEEFLYRDVTMQKSAINTLNTKKTGTEVYEYVFDEEDGVWLDLGFYTELQDKLNKTSLSELIAVKIQEKLFDSADPQGVTDIYKCIELIEALNESKIDNIADYYDRLILEDTKIDGWFKHSAVTEKVQTEITQRLSGEGIKTMGEFEAKFIEATVLSVVDNADGPGTVRDVITDYEDLIGVDASKADTSDWRSLAKSFDDFDAFKQKFNSLTGTSGESSSGGSSGGGGRGGATGIGGVSDSGFDASPSVPPVAQRPESGFSDLASVEWAREAVESLAEMGIINGRSETEFAPNENITREEFVKLIVLAFDIKQGEKKADFKDVEKGAWYEEYINTAYSAGIVNGVSEDEFGVGMEISRQDMSVMIYNAAEANKIVLSPVAEEILFSDADSIAGYAKEAVASLQTAGIINGVGDNCFEPNGNATRAQAAAMIYRLLNKN